MRLECYLSRTACLLAMLAFLLSVTAAAQTDQAAPETKIGNYVVSQSLEFGYRFTDVRGAQFPCPAGTEDRSAAGLCQDESMYNTFVNLHTGPRLLEQTWAMRSVGHTGVLFDNLFVNSFGWGGDPNNVGRLRINKSKVYNLTVTFRRDQNFFNYDLLANPLNVTAGSVTATGNTNLGFAGSTNGFLVTNSPHYFSTTRRMTDADLTLAPESVISLRLGYSRVRMEGPYGWTFHMPRGTDIGPAGTQNHTSDLYRVGVDFKFVPKTTISYDQFYTHNRIGLNAADQNFYFLVTGVGGVVTPTDLGVSWNLPVNQPCARPFLASGLANPACNQGLFFFMSNNFRTSIPTEQLSFQSHPDTRFDLSGRVMYSHSHMDGAYSHLWNGVTSTGRQQLITSAMKNKRDEVSADFGLTIHLTEKLRLLDNVRWYNWRIPTLSVENSLTFNPTPPTAPVNQPLGAPVPATVTGCSTPGPCSLSAFWKIRALENLAELEWDFTRAVGARIGYRYSDRFVFDRDETVPLSAEEFGAVPAPGDIESGEDRASVTGQTGVFGLWVRPSQKLRASFDGEITKFRQETGGGNTGIPPDTTFGLGPLPRIVPRREQQYRVRANYNPQRWMVLSASLNINQAVNRLATDDFVFHNYSGGFGVTLMPNDRYTFDVSYNYNDYLQNSFICPIGTGFGVPFGTTVFNTVCPFDINPTPPPLTTGLYQTLGRFESVNNFFSTLVRAKLFPRFAVDLGYSLSNNDGSQVFANPLLVPGSLKNSFHRPLAAIELELVKNWFAKAGWNYYDYNEKAAPGPTLVRDFHSNSGTFSLRYAF